MKQIVISILSFFFLLLPSGNANDKEFDLRVEEGHSLEGLMASQGCVISESEPFYIYVNGREILCDLNTMWKLSAENLARNEKLFEGKLNEYSSISLNYLFLNDHYNTPIAHVHIGKDPFGFFPNLPTASYDGRGNLISLTSYDINMGYFQYAFLYDEDDKITYAEERRYEIPLSTGERSKSFICFTYEWKYIDNNTYIRVARCRDNQPISEKPDTIYIMKYSNGFSVSNMVFRSEEEFQAYERMQTERTESTLEDFQRADDKRIKIALDAEEGTP